MLKKYPVYFLLILCLLFTACDNRSINNKSLNDNSQKNLYTNDVVQDSDNIEIKQEDEYAYKTDTPLKEANKEQINTFTTSTDNRIPVLDRYFEEYNEATCIIMNTQTGEKVIYNNEIVSKQMSPLSTFKVLNTLILLEEDVFKDTTEEIIWSEQIYSLESWNKNQTLKTAFQNSVVWVYDQESRKIHKNIYEDYLIKCSYGNHDVSGEGTFWLNSTLKITMEEQVEFMKDLCEGTLDFSKKAMSLVKELMLTEENAQYTLYGKTGSNVSEHIYLYTGFLVGNSGESYAFAVYIKDDTLEGLNMAKFRVLELFGEMFRESEELIGAVSKSED